MNRDLGSTKWARTSPWGGLAGASTAISRWRRNRGGSDEGDSSKSRRQIRRSTARLFQETVERRGASRKRHPRYRRKKECVRAMRGNHPAKRQEKDSASNQKIFEDLSFHGRRSE